VKSGGAEMVGQTNHLVRTRHDAQLASFASFFIDFYSWHKEFLPDSQKVETNSPSANGQYIISYQNTQLLF
jgi:hypothetical protein